MTQQSDVDDAATALNVQAFNIASDLDDVRAQTGALNTIRANIVTNAGSLTITGLLSAIDAVKAEIARVAP